MQLISDDFRIDEEKRWFQKWWPENVPKNTKAIPISTKSSGSSSRITKIVIAQDITWTIRVPPPTHFNELTTLSFKLFSCIFSPYK